MINSASCWIYDLTSFSGCDSLHWLHDSNDFVIHDLIQCESQTISNKIPIKENDDKELVQQILFLPFLSSFVPVSYPLYHLPSFLFLSYASILLPFFFPLCFCFFLSPHPPPPPSPSSGICDTGFTIWFNVTLKNNISDVWNDDWDDYCRYCKQKNTTCLLHFKSQQIKK